MLDRAMEKVDGQGNEGEEKEKWYVAAALVDAEEEVWKFGSHFFVQGTGDGGIAVLLGGKGKRKGEVWNEGTGSMLWTAPTAIEPSAEESTEGGRDEEPKKDRIDDDNGGRKAIQKERDELHLRCHCAAIHLFITRPPSPSIFTSIDPTLIPHDKSKWLALYDACDSCRLTSSSAIVSWLFPLRSCVSVYPSATSTPTSTSSPSLSPRTPYPADGLFSTAKAYHSSPGVTRTFCGTCGATISYACAEREDMVDIAAGLVVVDGEFGEQGVEGVRAEEWVEWRAGRVAWEGDAVWKGVVGGLKEGLGMCEGGK